MIAKRIIPCLDVDNGRVVKGVNFIGIKDAGDPVGLAIEYNKQGADELVFLDITASHEKRDTMVEVVRKTASVLFIPLTVGGGIRNIEDMRNMLNAGADKIGVNTAAIEDPNIIQEGADKFGSQCIVVAIDAKRSSKTESGFEVYTYGGRKPTGIDALGWAKKAESLGAGEILLTSMDRDGTKKGFDIELTKTISEAVNIPVIASGGVGSPKDFVDAFKKGKADAALAASIFHFGEYTVKDVKKACEKEGVVMRE